MNGAMDGAAHGHNAARPWRRLSRMDCATDSGANAVSANQQITLGAKAARYLEGDAIADGGVSDGLTLEDDRIHTDRVEKRTVQCRPQRHHHRATQHSGWQLRALQECAVHPADLAAPRLEAASKDGVGHAELPQGNDRVRRQAQPEPELAGRGRPFEDADVPPGLAERNAGGKAANAGPDNQGSTG